MQEAWASTGWVHPPGVLFAVEFLSFCKHRSFYSVSQERDMPNASDLLVETDSMRCILKSVPEVVLRLKVSGKPLLIRSQKMAQVSSFRLLQLIRE